MVHSTSYIKDNGTYPTGAGNAEVFDVGSDTMIDLMPDTLNTRLSTLLTRNQFLALK